jgi:hypothetical protein
MTLSVFTFSHRISNFFDLSITEETWVVEMRIWCIKLVNVLVLHSIHSSLKPAVSFIILHVYQQKLEIISVLNVLVVLYTSFNEISECMCLNMMNYEIESNITFRGRSVGQFKCIWPTLWMFWLWHRWKALLNDSVFLHFHELEWYIYI